MGEKRVFHSVQALRAVAAALVALFHAHLAFERANGLAPSYASYLFEFGSVGVHIFFVISGFVMVTTTAGKRFDPLSFLRRRVMRIYPIYWVCAAIYLGIFWALGQLPQLSAGEYLSAMLLTPTGAGLIIGPGWTLAFEMFFYVCFAAAMSLTLLFPRLSQQRATLILALAFCAGIGVRFVFWTGPYPWLNAFTNPLLMEFLAGAAIGWLVHADRLPRRWGGVMVLAGLALYAIFIAAGYDLISRVVTMGIGSALIVAGAIAIEQHRGAGRALRRAGRLGDSSYALYLIHIIALAVIVRAAESMGWQDAAPIWLIAVLLLPVLIALGELIHRTIEQPLLAWLPTRPPFRERRRASIANGAGSTPEAASPGAPLLSSGLDRASERG